MSPAKKSDQPRRSRRAVHRPTHEEQLRKLLGQIRRRDQEVVGALITVITTADARALAAIGVIVGFAVKHARARVAR